MRIKTQMLRIQTVPSRSPRQALASVPLLDATLAFSVRGVGATEDENSTLAVGMSPRESVGLPEGDSPSPEGVSRGRATTENAKSAYREYPPTEGSFAKRSR